MPKTRGGEGRGGEIEEKDKEEKYLPGRQIEGCAGIQKKKRRY